MIEDFDFVKWWGAILATVALCWNIWNSLDFYPKIKVRFKPNTSYPDSRIISIEKTQQGVSSELVLYCHIEITNIGKLPATVTNIELTHSTNKFGSLVSSSECFINHSKDQVPMLISPGALWSCRLEMDKICRMEKQGTPEIHISVSYKNSPIVVKPKYSFNS